VVSAAALTTRFAALSSKPFHHDETIHAWLSRQLAMGEGYRADPMFHGPLLYHLEAVAFRLGGQGEFQARFVTAAFGVVLIALLLRFVRFGEGDRVALTAALMAVASPTLTYYSRFNSHDILIAVFTILMIVLPFEYWRTGRLRYLLWLAAAFALSIATKLSAWFVVATLTAYFLAYAAYARSGLRHPEFTGRLRLGPTRLVAAGVVVASIVTVLFATTLVHYLKADPPSLIRAVRATLDSIAFSSFRYWAGVHNTPNLGGPFHYYFPLLFMYEPAVVLMGTGALVLYMRRRMLFVAAIACVLLAEALAVAVFQPNLPASFLRMQTWHLMLASCFALGGAWTVVSLLTVGRTALACWVFVGVSQLLVY
jgi:uncharacterized protein (TIGR03663 family)